MPLLKEETIINSFYAIRIYIIRFAALSYLGRHFFLDIVGRLRSVRFGGRNQLPELGQVVGPVSKDRLRLRGVGLLGVRGDEALKLGFTSRRDDALHRDDLTVDLGFESAIFIQEVTDTTNTKYLTTHWRAIKVNTTQHIGIKNLI